MRLLPRHWWENRFGPGEPTPLETCKRVLKEMFSKIRIDLCWGENDGFDVGCFAYDWKPSKGPFLFYRDIVDQVETDEGVIYTPGPWRLMVALGSRAFVGFDDGVLK